MGASIGYDDNLSLDELLPGPLHRAGAAVEFPGDRPVRHPAATEGESEYQVVQVPGGAGEQAVLRRDSFVRRRELSGFCSFPVSHVGFLSSKKNIVFEKKSLTRPGVCR